MNVEKRQIFIDAFLRILNVYTEMEKKPKDYGSGDILSPSEVHLLEAIGDHKEDIHITLLSEKMSVTKGAISQAINKLCRKGLVEKVKAEDNKSKILLHLTEKGKVACHGHAEYHSRMDKDIFNFLKTIDSDKADFLIDTFHELEDWLHRCLETER